MTPGPGAGTVEVVVDRMLAYRELEQKARMVVEEWERKRIPGHHYRSVLDRRIVALEDALLTLKRNPPPGRNPGNTQDGGTER